MTDTVHFANPQLAEPSIYEILRYMGCRKDDIGNASLIDECLDTVLREVSCRACYTAVEVSISGGRVMLGNIEVQSFDLAKNLSFCRRAYIFAVTLGIGVDRLISRYSRTSPARAVCIQAIGAERIEAACDGLEKIFSKNGKRALCPRFSAGYGDLPLELQRQIFSLLDCERKIGITLNESLLISPSKSVTAIVGIRE